MDEKKAVTNIILNGSTILMGSMTMAFGNMFGAIAGGMTTALAGAIAGEEGETKIQKDVDKIPEKFKEEVRTKILPQFLASKDKLLSNPGFIEILENKDRRDIFLLAAKGYSKELPDLTNEFDVDDISQWIYTLSKDQDSEDTQKFKIIIEELMKIKPSE
ncbi:MAG: hypothetical protein ACI83O_000171 [Patescibacteria group bacterium]|jgi:hypothetical protein